MAIVKIQSDDEIFAKAQSIAGMRGMDLKTGKKLSQHELNED